MRMLAALALPSNLALLLLILGILLALWWRTRRWATWLLGTGAVVIFAFSTGKVAAALMSPLEYAYPAVHEGGAHPEARFIVVLTAWAADDREMPLTARVNASGAYRVLMALELHRDRPDCRIIVSGDSATARIMADSLQRLGVPRTQILLEDESTNTDESIHLLAKLVGHQPFFLVSSAGHLPRSMLLVRQEGLTAIPVPTDYQLPRDWRRAELRPSPGSLAVSDLAVHEYLGMLWYRLRASD
jgi:uncharacterized SAM-binding protein YcdF (DUF218 family)